MKNEIITNILNDVYSILNVGQTQEEIEEYLGPGRTIKITQQYQLCRYLEMISDNIAYQTYNIGMATGRIKCFIGIKFKNKVAIEIIKKGIDGIYNKTQESNSLYKNKESLNQKLITWEAKLNRGSLTKIKITDLDSRLLNQIKWFCYNGKIVSYAQLLVNFPFLSNDENKLLYFLNFLKEKGYLLFDEKEFFSPVKKVLKWNINQKLPTAEQDSFLAYLDERFIDVGNFVTKNQEVSIGMIQRCFAIGFNRATKLINQLEKEEIIKRQHGKNLWTVLMTNEEFNKNYIKQ